ncbi:MAG: phage integrase SAM-like domain-containing protein [Bacteroidota bacterium]
MASVQFRLRSKANKNVSIKIRVSNGRSLGLELNTGFFINPKDWSLAINLPKQNNPENKQLSYNLKTLETFVLNNLNKDLSSNTLIDSYWLESKINECFSRIVKTDDGLLVNHIQFIIDNANTRTVKRSGKVKIGLSASTIKNYTSFKKIILEYQNTIKKQIQFLEITNQFVEKFKKWLVDTKNFSANYSGKHLEFLKTVCIDAGKHDIPVTPYSKTIQHFRESDEDRYIQTLSFDELTQIRNTDFSDIEHLKEFKKANPELTKNISITPEKLNNARNWILVGCEIGQRGGDLLDISSENIRYKKTGIYLDLIQQKTNKNVTVPIIAPHVIEILESQFPKKIQDQKLNDYAKVICKMAGIDTIVEGTKLNVETNRKEDGLYPKYDLIASHCFRRSFATNYYKIVPTAILITITGHSKESLFLTYINKREDKDANADLFMKFYETINKDKEPQLKVV